MTNNTNGYGKKDLTSQSSSNWDYVNENEVETEFYNKDEDFFVSKNEEDDEMNCVFF